MLLQLSISNTWNVQERASYMCIKVGIMIIKRRVGKSFSSYPAKNKFPVGDQATNYICMDIGFGTCYPFCKKKPWFSPGNFYVSYSWLARNKLKLWWSCMRKRGFSSGMIEEWTGSALPSCHTLFHPSISILHSNFQTKFPASLSTFHPWQLVSLAERIL